MKTFTIDTKLPVVGDLHMDISYSKLDDSHIKISVMPYKVSGPIRSGLKMLGISIKKGEEFNFPVARHLIEKIGPFANAMLEDTK